MKTQSWHELHPGPSKEIIEGYGSTPIDDLVGSYREDLKIIWSKDFENMEDGEAEDLYKQMAAKERVLVNRIGDIAVGCVRYDITKIHPETGVEEV